RPRPGRTRGGGAHGRARGRPHRRRRPRSGRPGRVAPPPVRPLLQGGPVACRRQLRPGAGDRLGTRGAPGRDAPGEAGPGWRHGLRPHPARDPIVPAERSGRYRSGRCWAHVEPHTEDRPVTAKPVTTLVAIAALILATAACSAPTGALGSPNSPA